MAAKTELRVAGILLAAGASRRMGTNKLLLEFEGESLVRRAARRALAAGLDPLVVVLGHEADRVRAALEGLACEFTLSPDIGGPMSASVHAGLMRLSQDVDAAIILLADMPYVTHDMLRALRLTADEVDAPLVISTYGGTTAPPVLFRRSLFVDLLKITGESVGREVIQRHQGEAAVTKWPEDLLDDVDTPEEFSGLR